MKMGYDGRDTKELLLLTYNNDREENILLGAVSRSGIMEAGCILTHRGLLLRCLRRYVIRYHLPGMGFWLGDWKERLSSYGTIVMTASGYTPEILKWIHKRCPGIRLINYYWDKIEISKYPVVYCDDFENWSFDREDAGNYGFSYNPQYYSGQLRLPAGKLKYDISFVGADREGNWPERTELVNRYYEQLQKAGLNTFFYYVSGDRKSNPVFTHTKRMSEREYLKVVSESRAVLDLVQPERGWMTQRPLLALSNQKKIVTNYHGIMDYDFYNKENIFILGSDAADRLYHFVHQPFRSDRNSRLGFYEADKWAARFLSRK